MDSPSGSEGSPEDLGLIFDLLLDPLRGLVGHKTYAFALHLRKRTHSSLSLPSHAIAPKGQWTLTGGATPEVGVRTLHSSLLCIPEGCRPCRSLSVFSPTSSPAPLQGAGERGHNLACRWSHHRLSAARPSGALLFFLCARRGKRLRQPLSAENEVSLPWQTTPSSDAPSAGPGPQAASTAPDVSPGSPADSAQAP